MRLDDQLRSVPESSLFRRTSSAVANPTTQGVTLRGLSASGASRTLVVSDDVPLNDPFGAWVYWDRVPMVALQRVDVIRGASGDIHGNDALGGVIRLTTRTTSGAEGWFDGGSLGTARGSGYGALSRGTWMAGASAEAMKTDGYIVVGPEARGSIDVPADSRSTSAMGWGGGTRGPFQATLRGGYFDERRGNGTPAQVNATITRWSGANAPCFRDGSTFRREPPSKPAPGSTAGRSRRWARRIRRRTTRSSSRASDCRSAPPATAPCASRGSPVSARRR